MALYTCVTPTAAGATATGVAVASTDTIPGNAANAGAVLLVTCAATPCTVTFTDGGRTAAGTAAAALSAVSVLANTTKAFGNLGPYVDASTNLVTVAYSATTNITAQLVS